MTEYENERARMVERQIASRGVHDKLVLEAMRSVPRHEFVAPTQWNEAYNDYPLPIGFGQTISQPYIVALMTELLRVLPEHHVLEIGSGSGYQAAVLARLAARVTTVERIAELAERARETLKRLGITNVRVTIGDGTIGLPEDAPYDRIIVTAAAPSVPKALTDQLAEGGRMVIPVGSEHLQDMVMVRKEGGEVSTEQSIGCRFVRLIGEQGWTDDQ
jgi:protein-L-isoaspartate(D-aspartate) O-methyltransferase